MPMTKSNVEFTNKIPEFGKFLDSEKFDRIGSTVMQKAQEKHKDIFQKNNKIESTLKSFESVDLKNIDNISDQNKG